MAKINIMKFVAMMMVMKLIIVAGAATTHNNGGYRETISLSCIATCAVMCIDTAEFMPICMAGCLLTCSKAPKSDSDFVKNCTSTCAQSLCSKYVGSDINKLGECVADDCAEKCLAGARY